MVPLTHFRQAMRPKRAENGHAMEAKRKAKAPAPAALAAKKGGAGRGAGRKSGLAAAAQKEVEAANAHLPATPTIASFLGQRGPK